MYYIISKSNIKAWLRKLVKQGILVAPVRLPGGDVIYKEILAPDDALLEFKQPLNSAKSFFLPQEETLFTFSGASVESLQEVFDIFPRVVFGLRPCDLKALTQADRFFGEDYRDAYYHHRRQGTLVIGMACTAPGQGCFCHLMGLGPFYKEGADLFMVDLGDSFAVTAETDKGLTAIEQYIYFFEIATEEQQNEILFAKFSAGKKLKSNLSEKIALPDLMPLTDESWAEIAQRCFSCGSCSYICPLCFCYNVVDRQQKTRPEKGCPGKRVRTWDSCIFEGFTRMAGRHNLFEKRQDRLKKRFAHKLEQYPEKYGYPGCTGCGRCSVTCLGGIGMLEIVKRMVKEVAADGKKHKE